MSTKLRLLIVILATALVANVGWRVWVNRGRVTIDADDQPVAEVVRSLQRQGRIRIVSNVAAETKVTMHVRKVPLLHALEVLAANAGASWRLAYVTAPDQGAIEAALGTLAGGTDPEGWKRWSMPPMRGFGDEAGSIDPRLEEWKPKPANEANLHAYLTQASTILSAQFWAPEQWNPAVSAPPKAGRISGVAPKLAKAAGGRSVELFLLRARRQMPDFPAAPVAGNRDREGAARMEFREPTEEMRKAMEERMNAQIERLPKDKQAEARARFEEGRKMSEEMAKLSPEERRAKMEENFDKMLNTSTNTQMMTEGARRGAMQTADQRADRYRDYLDKKREMQ